MNLADKVKQLAIETPFTEGQIASSLTHRAQRGLTLDLQHFAEPEDDLNPEDKGGGQKPDDDPTKQQGEDTFTQSELDSAVSKAVDKALANKQKEFEKEKERIEEQARQQGEEYAKLTKQQKEDAEYKNRLEKLEARERELNQKQLRSEVQSDLKDNGLPDDFAEPLIALEDNDKIKESIENIKKAFDSAVNDAVKEKLRQGTPKQTGGAQGGSNPFAKETFNLTEQARLYREEPEKYKQLKAQA
ncbi:hypothetical protein J18TS1_12500 [Oceanobacillus oncorhynchi subsp. incaldanensis]|uniref:DUF4355 domain-containing protein n=1 Tax=Oceanobacillus oncorhynchi TaxID=545501 RepID=UPI001B0BFBBB|nr:DUF4355 domain-containing protein [Oceanobacillus oncorhynchi]GIO18150.1 hypothetical protein J18TS1_12500 [Oceanobacillus oncorhynchi subsp. incaldanensis]